MFGHEEMSDEELWEFVSPLPDGGDEIADDLETKPALKSAPELPEITESSKKVPKVPASDWPKFDLWETIRPGGKFTESSKKGIFPHRFRNDAMLTAIRLGAANNDNDFLAGFSLIAGSLKPSLPFYKDLTETRLKEEHYIKPCEWRYTSPKLQAYLFQIAMHGNNNYKHIPFTLNLSPQFVKNAIKHEKGFLDFTKRKLDKSFSTNLHYIPQYWFIVELETLINGHKRPHLHGSLYLQHQSTVVENKQKTPISKACGKAIGKIPPAFSNRLYHSGSYENFSTDRKITELQAKFGWVNYCFKDHTRSRVFLNDTINLVVDNETRRQAKDIYSNLSAIVNKHL